MENANPKDIIYYGIAENESYHLRTKPTNYLNIMTWEISWNFDKLECQKKYFNIVSEVLLSIYDLSKFTIILDAYPLYSFRVSEFNSIAQFIQNRKCNFYFDKKFASFTIETDQDVQDFALEMFQLYHRLFLRVYKKNELDKEELGKALKNRFGNHEDKYIKKIENFESILTIAKRYFFIGIISKYRTFNQNIEPIGKIIKKYDLDFKSTSES